MSGGASREDPAARRRSEAPAGATARPAGLRATPGEDLPVAGPLRRLWRRLHLVPFLLLILAVIAAAIAGAVTQSRLAASDPATAPPAAPGEAPALDADSATCAPPVGPIPSDQPWQGAARADSESVYAAHTSPGAPIVEGRDGWVFWGDYQWRNFSQGLGRYALTRAQADAWAEHYERIEEELAARGIPFVILIAPAKWDAYRDQLPEWADGIQGSTSFDYLRAAHPELPIIDVRDAVRHSPGEPDTYERQNSHWSPYGGYLAWKQAAACLAERGGALAGLAAPSIAGVEVRAGANEFAPYGIETGIADQTVPVWADAPSPMTITDKNGDTRRVDASYATDMLEAPATTVTERPMTQARALVVRDSFGSALAPSLQASFAETVQISHSISSDGTSLDVVAEADQVRPDVVIYEFTERYLYFVPGQPS